MSEPSDQNKLTKPYDSTETEKRIYELWENSGYFNPDNLPKINADKMRTGRGQNEEEGQRKSALSPRQSAFTIIMPPPNANGHLHAGHALFITLEDIMIRYKRMQGFKTLWLPGTDHAGFETQVVFEKQLEKEGKSRFDFSREELYDAIMKFTLENQNHTENGLRSLGASCDWSREKFTLDPDIIKTVYATFQKLTDDGLVYRGRRIVNWCTKHQTSLSDLETEAETQTDKLYYLQYGPLIVATVRPETMFGDVAIAVNPEDERYQEYIGQTLKVQTPIGTMDLKVIADPVVEKDFGTGALKITPAHDANDYEIAKRHNLDSVEVIDHNGKLNTKTGKYAGLKVAVAREQVVADLKTLGLLIKEEAYEHAVIKCYKCNRILEPRIMPQWFIKMETLAKPAIEAVKNGEIKIIPDWQEKVYFNWLNDIRDWNISRQIAWGIPIPAKICPTCDYGLVDLDQKANATCPHCQTALIADPDTFDTWFSSGQWPFATLAYPDGEDYRTFYPTSVMETGSDLIFFWVARMIMLGLYRTGQVPFKTVYFHGMVRDAKNQKMSKSKGNVISPIELGTKYGTDALRMALIIGNTPGTALALDESKIRGYKNFANKIWNISRFILDNTKSYNFSINSDQELDIELMTEFNSLAKEVTADLDNFRFYLAGEKIYHYLWHRLADQIIEDSKTILARNDETAKKRAFSLQTILAQSLKLLHPFMPFVTEEIWQISQFESDSLLMISAWPNPQ
ncbi:MAG: valine--tRNA ligase [Candidatus Vogelbacteria bacterium CG22_combo_CG10-13_8_21_14_all_37_9]|uniref:Valine--tRNA ligase n=1 Tax=Candidatus Vogelbacteria bacterium CG22_combo_CG10-13_8_21_14_all_37_9 TaxID=1975046 RepID=A0A2H0BM86_9BACT|nr:MAG: valine--tRNA ligase [Candidatus Vogelbacteria bacterium CG22_combo_CG10-13_8_21_14_all_37_9]